MNDAVVPPADGATAGQLLRQARETAGLHVATLAVALKVPVRKLEALEEDRYDQLPDAVFVRALASSVCRTLKVDAQPILERLPQVERPRLLPQDQGINAPFRAPGDGPAPGLVDQVSRPVVLTVIALLLGAIVLIFLPARHEEAPAKSEPVKTAAAPAPAPAETQTAPAQVPALAASVAAAPAIVASPAVAPAPAAPPAATASRAVAAAGTATTVSASTTSTGPATAAAPAAPASGIVVFRAKGESWVKVSDAKGTTVLQKLMKAGESAGASSANLPLSVTVGSAEATEVQVRGQPFNLAPLARDNVARFEVK